MINIFPNAITQKAVTIYLVTLAGVSLLFSSHAMKPIFLIIGVTWVALFFFGSSHFTKKWTDLEQKKYVRKLFSTAVSIRIIWVLFSYIFFLIQNDMPFEFGSSDAISYHEAAIWYNEIGWADAIDFQRNFSGVSDSGYVLYLMALYKLVGPNIIIARIIKALLSSWMCVMIYHITRRNFGESTGRMAGLFCCLMPNLILYCGLHLKETEMLFLTVACLERVDYLLHEKKARTWNLILSILLIASLFTFRTVLGATMVFAIFTALIFYRTRAMTRWNRIILIFWAISAVALFAGGRISHEVTSVWNNRSSNQTLKRDKQVRKGIEWAKYATGTVMAPMMFVLPFPTMVDVDRQYNQQLISGGNYVKNFMAIFVIIAIFSAVFVNKDWRKYTLIGTFLIAYLGVICMSGFANSERFLLPGVPMLMILAACGVSQLSGKNIIYVKFWYIFVPVMVSAWAFFKLGARGLI